MLNCTHTTNSFRKRIRETIENSSAYAFLSLKFEGENLEVLISSLSTFVVTECGKIMIEHGDELIEEFKRMLDQSKGT
jgi:hypothetical protein